MKATTPLRDPGTRTPKLPAWLLRTGLLLIVAPLLGGCATRYETVRGVYVHGGPDRGIYSGDALVVRDRATGEMWQVNPQHPNRPLWVPFRSGSSK